MELTRRFDADTFARALQSWAWLIGERALQPLATSLFGDVFFRGEDGVWYLDALEGTLTLQWPDVPTLRAELDTDDGEDHYLMGGIAMAAERKGIVPGPMQVLCFTKPPALGGPISPDNVQAMDYVVASWISGQLRQQLSERPNGAEITGFTLSQ